MLIGLRLLAGQWLLEYNAGDRTCGGGILAAQALRHEETMPTIVQTARHLRRYQQVGRILTRYGFGHVLTQLGIGRAITPGLERLRFSSAEILRATPAERVRMVIEELGPTFIKLGQILSTRGDIIPADMIRELEKLQDTVPPTGFDAIKDQVEKELGKPLDEVFPTFDPQPVASASLGQVHLATLADGTEVAVKVFRPGIDRIIETDLDILQELATLAERRTEWGEYYGVLSLAQEFAETLRTEQNYEQEGHSIDRYRKIFAGESYVHIPKVYWETTTRRVLTMERIEGIKITDVAALDAAGLDRRKVARRNIRILLRAVLQEGFFHADPHAGNFLVEPDEVIGMLDFGIMGHLDPAERLGMIQLFVGFFGQNTDQAVEAFRDLGIATRAADKRNLTRDLHRLHQQYYGLDLEKLHARSFVEDFMGVAYSNRLKLPSNLVLVFKAIAMLEGISLRLDPDINIFEEVEPYVRDALFELKSPITRLRDLSERLQSSADALVGLPKQVQRLLEQFEDGEGHVGIRLRGIEEPTRQLTAAANRLALAVLAVAFILGPALILPQVQDIWPESQTAATMLVIGGFVMSILITLVLALSIWRSR
jgi:ubiquinone biosynthesis protein